MSISPIEFFSTDNKGGMTSYDSRRGMYPGYTHILTGKFGAGGACDFFGYDPVTGQGDIWTTNDQGGVVWARSFPSLPKGCTQVVAPNITGDDCRDLMFYEPKRGKIDFYAVNTPGTLTHLSTLTGVRQTWTSMTMSGFGSRPYHNLFFYDAAAGLGEFYAADGKGGLELVGQNSSLRKGCAQVTCGNFGGGKHADLVFYDPAAGIGEFYTVEEYQIARLSTITTWRKTWTLIVAGKFSDNTWSDLLFYDASRGEVSIHSTDGKGGLHALVTHARMPTNWTQIAAAGRFSGAPASTPTTTGQLLCYGQTVGLDAKPSVSETPQPAPAPRPEVTVIVQPRPTPSPPPTANTGRGEIYSTVGGKMTLLATHKGMRSTWTHVMAGNFGGQYADLFFYDAAAGYGQIMGMDDGGRLSALGTYNSLREGCIAGVTEVSSGYTNLGLYDPSSGTLEVYNIDGPGKMSLRKTLTGLSKGIKLIVPGHYDAKIGCDVMLYDAAAGQGQFWSVDDKSGDMSLIKTQQNWSKTWTRIVPANFGFLLYDKPAGLFQLWRVNGADTSVINTYAGNRKTWTDIASSRVSMTHPTEILYYDASAGRAEFYQCTSNGNMNRTITQDGMPKDVTHVAMREMWTAKYSSQIFCYSPTGG